VCLKAS